MTSPTLAIVIPVLNEGDALERMLETLAATTDVPCEIVIVDDGSIDGCCDGVAAPEYRALNIRTLTQSRRGIAAARNRGASATTAPILVFIDGHCSPPPGWARALLDRVAAYPDSMVTPCITVAGRPHVKGYGMTLNDPAFAYRWLPRPSDDEPAEVPIACGCCVAMRRTLFDALGGWDAMREYGFEDVELSLRCWLAGHSVRVAPDVEVAHRFKTGADVVIHWEPYIYNALRTATRHFDGPRRARIFSALSAKPQFAAALDALLATYDWVGDAATRAARRRTADWYCERFAIDL